MKYKSQYEQNGKQIEDIEKSLYCLNKLKEQYE